VSFRHAYELLAEGGKSAFSTAGHALKSRATIPRLNNPFDPSASDADLLAQVIDYYHERLFKNPAALDYLRKRGLDNEEVLRRFKIGFADRSLGLRLPEKSRKAGRQMRGRLQALGLIRESGHEHFNGSIVVPIPDATGRISQIYGRKITPNLRKGTPRHLYLPGQRQGIWNADAFESSELILCEAPIDALTFVSNGFADTTFIHGPQGFTQELFDALIKHHVRRIRIAYDNDKEGNLAAERDAQRLASAGIEVFRIRFPRGMDANAYALKFKPASPSLQGVIGSAQWLGGSPHVPSLGVSDDGSTASPDPVEAAEEKTPKPENPLHPVRSVKETPALLHKGEYHFLGLGSREYRVGGFEKNNSLDVMKITLRIRNDEDFHLDSIDLARDTERRRFIERAHEETRLEKALIKRDMGKLLLALEDAQMERLNAALKPETGNVKPDIPEDERREALEFLRSPDLTRAICDGFDNCGLVGEETNRLAAYLACTSRKLARPLAVIVQSTSAAGKSTLMDSVLAMFPAEEQVKYSAMTGQSLYYLGEKSLTHRILAIAEEEGAVRAGYALKLLQSEGELIIASTGKDPHTGRMETQEYRVEGPVMIFLTTTSIDIDEELQNRCLTLSVDESRPQTRRIHELQRKARTLDGLRLKKERQRVLTLMQNAQRLLEPLEVVNPYADLLTFTAERTRTRRDHEKYLTLIDAVALLHQHQRPRKKLECGTQYIEATLADIELANALAPELFSRSLDELPPQTRLLLGTIKQLVRERCESDACDQRFVLFTRKDLRERNGWSYSQVKRHLERLQELEYICVRHGRMGMTHSYGLLVDAAESDAPGYIGLIDPGQLKGTTATRTGETPTLTPGCQNAVARLSVEMPALKENLATFSVRTSGVSEAVES
jgi:hypothetical protein